MNSTRRALTSSHLFISKHYRYAIVGASADPKKYGNIVFFDLKNAGYMVTPVNPKLGELGGVKAAGTLKDVRPVPDVAVVVVPPAVGLSILDDAKAAGVKKLWFQPGAESEEIREKSKHLGLAIVADRSCIMIVRKKEQE